ncbi:hypothetical protein [Paraburkholderia terrae]
MTSTHFNTPRMWLFAAMCITCSSCLATPTSDCNPNRGQVTYDEPAAQELENPDWENQTYLAFALLGATQIAYTQANFANIEYLAAVAKKTVHLGTGKYNNQDIPLTADKLTELAPLSSTYIDDNTILLLFLSDKQTGWKCNAVRHRLFVAKVLNIRANILTLKFGGLTFTAPIDQLENNTLYEVKDVPENMSGRIFVLTPSTYYYWLKNTSSAYSQSFKQANAVHRPDILEAYLAIGSRYVRMIQAHLLETVVSVNDDDLWAAIKSQSDSKIDCTQNRAQELCILAVAMRKSEADARTTAFKITDSIFNNSGASFGWQQLDIGVNDQARAEAFLLFSTPEWSKQRLQGYMYPIRKFSISTLSGLYGEFVPLADSKLTGRTNQLAVVSAYASGISDELAKSTPMANLPKQMSDDDKRLIRLLQADRANVGGTLVVVTPKSSSICDVIDATPDRRKGALRHDRWVNIVNAYNNAYGTSISSCD